MRMNGNNWLLARLARWQKIILAGLLLVFVLFTAPNWQRNPAGDLYIITPDTWAYRGVSLNPWQSIRSPGYQAVVNLFLAGKRAAVVALDKNAAQYSYQELFGPARTIEKLYRQHGLANRLNALVCAQILLLALAVAALFLAISRFVPAPAAFVCVMGALLIAPGSNPCCIMSESLAQPLTYLALACLLFFWSGKKFFWLYLACALSVWAYLARISCLSLLLLTTCCVVFCPLAAGFCRWRRYGAALLLLLPGYAYIALLSITGGHFFVGTLAEASNNIISLWFLEPGDIQNMPTERAKKFAAAFLEGKPEFEKTFMRARHPGFAESRQKYSPQARFNLYGWNYAFEGTLGVYDKLAADPDIGPLSLRERARLSHEVRSGVMRRHRAEWLALAWHNFWAALGYDKTLALSRIASRLGSHAMTAGLLLILAAALAKPAASLPPLLLAAAHLLQLLACAVGTSLNQRYIELTEPLLAIAIFLAVYSLCHNPGKASPEVQEAGAVSPAL